MPLKRPFFTEENLIEWMIFPLQERFESYSLRKQGDRTIFRVTEHGVTITIQIEMPKE